MNNKILNNYLKIISEIHLKGDAREETFYPALKDLVLQMAEVCEKQNINITIMPKKTEAGNPDFRVWDGKLKIVGYIEAKKPEVDDLDNVENTDQIKRYLGTFPNFILTNFLEFRFYRNGELIQKINIGRAHTLLKIGSKPVAENESTFQWIFENFFSFTFPQNLNARQLATELAKRTRFLRDYVIIEELREASEDQRNYIAGFYEAFKKYLIHGLTASDFADLYSQTITYSLFAARTRCTNGFNRQNAINFIPGTIGMLHDIFQFVSLGELPMHMESIIDDIVDVLASVNVNKILNEFFQQGKGEDPIVHFYETFLSEYDPGMREKRGVYYTPEPVVSFIVRSLNWILKEKFDLNEGFADKRVKVLDPAAGTLTFITEAAKLALKEFEEKFGSGMKEEFVRTHILADFYAFELMMAPYAIGHLKMAYVLDEMDFKLTGQDRFNLYLTNTLDMEEIEQSNLPGMATLSEESKKAGKIKKQTPILVILGNPPYSGHSANLSEKTITTVINDKEVTRKIKTWIGQQIENYKIVDGKPLGERNPKWLQDDYVKFIRFAQWKIEQHGEGLIGIITNHGYLDNPTFRGMRQSLLKTFNEIYILDLHGNSLKKEKCPDGSPDKNVFDIMQGVSIGLFIKKKGFSGKTKIYHSELWGDREEKYAQLKSHELTSIQWKEMQPHSEFYFFVPRDESGEGDWLKHFKITDVFPVNGVGMTTARDDFVIDFERKKLLNRILSFRNNKSSDDELHHIFQINKKLGWNIRNAWNMIQNLSDLDIEKLIVPVLYRPFDVRWIFYHDSVVWRTVKRVMKNMLRKNISIITSRLTKGEKFKHLQVTDTIVEVICMSPKTSNNGFVFPLYLYPERKKKSLFSELEASEGMIWNNQCYNFSREIFNWLQEGLDKAKKEISPEQIFYYIYAVLSSAIYREKYAEFLRSDFPRVPFTRDFELLDSLADLGERLTEIHLLKSSELKKTFAKFEGLGQNVVEKVMYGADQVWINDQQYFTPVPEPVWNYQIGGYQVMSKWLKDRKNRTLSLADVQHYIQVAKALQLTIEIQQQIDNLYPQVEKSLLKKS